LTGESDGVARSRVSGRRRRWRRAAIVPVVLVVVASLAAARLFAWPERGMPPRVNAILMLNSVGDPARVALRLARQGRAGYLVLSQGSVASHYACPAAGSAGEAHLLPPLAGHHQGEVEFAARLAARHHWHSVAVVAITPQASRARLRLERCFAGHVYVVTASIPLSAWPYQIAYESGAPSRHCGSSEAASRAAGRPQRLPRRVPPEL